MNKDVKYQSIIRDIISNKEFEEIENIIHHGTTRLVHSKRVSYCSYKIAVFLRLNSESCARAGLLHDFFTSAEDRTKIQRFISTFTHPKYALKNASAFFELTDLEKDIIRKHMFPINLSIPKYAESWLVSFVDKIVTIYDFISSRKIIKKLSHR